MANPFFQWKVEKHANGDRSPFGQVLRPLLSCLMMRVDGQASVRVIMMVMVWIAMGVRITNIAHAKIILLGKTICYSYEAVRLSPTDPTIMQQRAQTLSYVSS